VARIDKAFYRSRCRSQTAKPDCPVIRSAVTRRGVSRAPKDAMGQHRESAASARAKSHLVWPYRRQRRDRTPLVGSLLAPTIQELARRRGRHLVVRGPLRWPSDTLPHLIGPNCHKTEVAHFNTRNEGDHLLCASERKGASCSRCSGTVRARAASR
jgi:hypothetical protein